MLVICDIPIDGKYEKVGVTQFITDKSTVYAVYVRSNGEVGICNINRIINAKVKGSEE